MSEPIPAPSQPPVRKNIPIPSTEPERRATFGKIDPESRIAAAVTARAAAGAGDTAAISPGMIAPPERGIASLARAKKASGSRLLVRPPSGPEPVAAHRKPGGSISDRIRSLSGKAYDVYREIFLERVRSDIHHHLLANQTRSHGIFDTAANEAEDQIFGFMAAHYDDPFMDWEIRPGATPSSHSVFPSPRSTP